MSVCLRHETPADEAAIAAVTIAAFRNAAHSGHNEHRIVGALRAAGRLTVSLVAEADGQVVGHAAASPVTVSDGAQGWYGLGGPVSVSPEHHDRGIGIGSSLVREVLRFLADRHAAGCVVLGEPAYYGRFGFRPQPGLVLPGVPPEYFQALAFRSTMPSGRVSYDEAFMVSAE